MEERQTGDEVGSKRVKGGSKELAALEGPNSTGRKRQSLSQDADTDEGAHELSQASVASAPAAAASTTSVSRNSSGSTSRKNPRRRR